MRKNIWLIIFLLVLAANIIAVYLQNENLRFIVKPLLVPAVAFYFLTTTNSSTSFFKGWIIMALFFSWVGDILLLFEAKKSIFFLLGLSAFLLAHIFYIVFFHNIR